MSLARLNEKPSLDDASIAIRRALVSRVVRSPSFAKSERLSSLLSCICELTLEGRSSEIDEQMIGILLYHKKPGYDSATDGIVRTQASRLRQRLDLFFSREGVEEPIRIVLPRGGYVPHFEARSSEMAPVPTPTPSLVDPPIPIPPPQSVPAKRSKSGFFAWLLVAVLSVIVLALVYLLRTDTHSRPLARGAVNPLLKLFFRDQSLMIVPSDTGLVMWEGLAGRQIDLADYLNGNYRIQVPSGFSAQQNVGDSADRRYTSIVDLNIVKAISERAALEGATVNLRYARDVRMNDLKHGNAILIGASAANPWVELYEPKMNFIFSDPKPRQYTIINRAPIGSEPPRWQANYDDPQHRVYGVVAFLPNMSGDGSVLILEGTSMAGTECAWDFVADQNGLKPFLARIRHSDGTIPHFQILLLAYNMNGNSTKSQVLAFRTVSDAASDKP